MVHMLILPVISRKNVFHIGKKSDSVNASPQSYSGFANFVLTFMLESPIVLTCPGSCRLRSINVVLSRDFPEITDTVKMIVDFSRYLGF